MGVIRLGMDPLMVTVITLLEEALGQCKGAMRMTTVCLHASALWAFFKSYHCGFMPLSVSKRSPVFPRVKNFRKRIIHISSCLISEVFEEDLLDD